MKKALAAAIILSAVGAQAQAAGDPQAGEAKSAVCAGCHGPDGNAVAPMFPKLAGQHASYLAKQLREFQSGARQNETMAPFAMGLSEQDIQDLAAFYAGQQLAPAEPAADAETLARGRQLYMGGDRYKDVPACAGCHSPTGSGNPPAMFPLLKAQYADYINAQLAAFAKGERANDREEMMRTVAGRMSANDMAAVAAYIAGLPVEGPAIK